MVLQHIYSTRHNLNQPFSTGIALAVGHVLPPAIGGTVMEKSILKAMFVPWSCISLTMELKN